MIYFIQETGLFRNRVKIGITNDIRKRLGQFRSCSASSLKILLLLPGSSQEEIFYHERFAKYRLHGEWFKYGLGLKLFVWMNQIKFIPILFKRDTPEELAEDYQKELAYEAKAEFDKTEAEKTVIKTYTELIQATPLNDLSWRTATQFCYGDGKYGTYYNKKLTITLDKYGVDHTILLKNGESKIEQNLLSVP